MVVAQRVKEAEITEQDSLLLVTRNLLRIAIFNISYIRGLFPEKYFNDKMVPALEMKIKKLMPVDAESRRLIDWMEKGAYDALQKKYLKTLLFCICEQIEGPVIEEYSFSFNYANPNGNDVCLNVSRNGNKNGATFKSNTADVTPDQMRSSACKMVRTLVQLMRTLDQMPSERIILMKLLYYDDVTPEDYEPPFFRCCLENEASNIWAKNPLKMEVGNVNSKHIVLALKVKSILDPCEDENNDLSEDDGSLGADSIQEDSSDGEVQPSTTNQFMVALVGNIHPAEDNGKISEDETHDVAHEEEQTARVREWIISRHMKGFDVADILSAFPDISVALTEGILERLLTEGLLSKSGKDTYTINKEKNPEISSVKHEVEMQDAQPNEKSLKSTADQNDYLYMKALYHALPMDFVSVGKLQSKLEGVANQSTVRSLIDKMAQEGYVEKTSNRRFGKRVIRSEITDKKLLEVQKALDGKLGKETNAQAFEFNPDAFLGDHQNLNVSTCGGLHYIGSELTCTRARTEIQQDGGAATNPLLSNQTPTSKAEPISSLESGVLGKQSDRGAKGRPSFAAGDCRPSQEKRSRKCSTVKEPTLQFIKRQKVQTEKA